MGPRLDVDFRLFSPERPPVFLLGGLNLVRPLGFARIPTIVVSPDPRAAALSSRYCTGRCLVPPLENKAMMAEALMEAGDRVASALGGRAPLFYGNDDYLELVHTYREEFSRRFLLQLNDPEVTCALIDKDRFARLARDRGLPVPRTLTWGDAGADSMGEVEGPVLVKPKSAVDWEESPVHRLLLGGQGKALVFENGRKLMEHPQAARLRDQLTIQEFIPGGDDHLWSFHGFADEESNVLASFIGRKVRTFPASTGASSFLEMAYDDNLEAVGRDIVARVPLKGPFKIDLKRDPRNGRLYMLEINARFNLWHHMAARNGINLPLVAYDYLVRGTRPAGSRYRTAYKWLDFRLDWQAFRELSDRGELSLMRWLGSLLLSRKVYSVFSWTDPVPYMRLWSGRLGSRLRRWLSTAS